jgi:UDP-N-acetylmuramate--alanine ligase
MRSLADVFSGMGWTLSGSDLTLGGHHPARLPDETELVVYSAAVPADNPELCRARELGIPAYSCFEAIGRLMSGRNGLAVAGTHGKSTTTAMAAEILVGAGMDPTVLFGAAALGARSGGRAGRSDLVLAEACEYRGNFLHLAPRHAVILGIEPDHFDCYPSLDRLQEAFGEFAGKLPESGWLLVRHDCPIARRVAARAACAVETFGIQPGPDWSARGLRRLGKGQEEEPLHDTSPKRKRGSDNANPRLRFGLVLGPPSPAKGACPRFSSGCYALEIYHGERSLGVVELGVPGRHNVLNALAAAALASAVGAAPEQIGAGLGRFRGLQRRLEVLGNFGGVVVIDDYAHHPTEVSASLAAVREMYPCRPLCCVFQPHQVSRTERLLDELAESLQNVERVVVAEIFRAREGPVRAGEVTAADLARQIRTGGAEALAIPTWDGILRYLETHLTAGDVLVTMGAGDIGRMTHEFVERLRENRAVG